MFVIFTFILGPMLAYAGFETPPLEVTAYQSLGFSLSKDKLQLSIQQAADGLYGASYVDIGDMSDFMHGHLFLGAPSLILFHTKEYDFLRKGRPYKGPHGILDPNIERNYILWLEDNPHGRAGEVVEAHPFSKFPERPDLTVSIRDLNTDQFKMIDGDNDESFYFFRVACEDADQAASQLGMVVESNLIEIRQGALNERVCLALVNFHCRNKWQRDPTCRDEQLLAPFIHDEATAPVHMASTQR